MDSVENDILIAKEALAEGDIPHALHHINWALNVEPENVEALTILDGIIADSAAPLDLIPITKQMSTAEAAGRAYILARTGSYDAAVDILRQVIEAMPNVGYGVWAVRWILTAESQIETLTILHFLRAVTAKYYNEPMENRTACQIITDLIPTLNRLCENNPDDPMVPMFCVMAIRKAGHCDAALMLAKKNYGAHPGKNTAVSLATTLRKCGDYREAVRVFEEGLQSEPDDLYIPLDLGDILCENEEYERGLAYYQCVLDQEPEHQWAKPHFLFYQYIMTRDESWRDQLAAYIDAHPDNDKAVGLGKQLWIGVIPYIDYLPSPGDATINVLRQITEKEDFSGGNLNLGLSALESPSSRLALERFLKQYDATAEVSVAQVQSPDPRLPRGQVEHLLWTYNGTDPRPAVPPPFPSIASSVATLAAQEYVLDVWRHRARMLGELLDESHIPDLLSTMLYPADCPPEIAIWDWLYRNQFAAALTIAFIENQEAAKTALVSLLNGPMDWTVGAAALALSEMALQNPALETEILNLLLETNRNLPDGYVPYHEALRAALTRLPSEIE